MPFRRPLRRRPKPRTPSHARQDARDVPFLSAGGRFVELAPGRAGRGANLLLVEPQLGLQGTEPLQQRAIGQGMQVVAMQCSETSGRSELTIKTLKAKLSYYWWSGELLELEAIGSTCGLALAALAAMPGGGTRSGPTRLNLIAPELDPLDGVNAKSLDGKMRTTIYVADEDVRVNYHDPVFDQLIACTSARVFYAEGAAREELITRTAKRKMLTRAPVPHTNPQFQLPTVPALTRQAG